MLTGIIDLLVGWARAGHFPFEKMKRAWCRGMQIHMEKSGRNIVANSEAKDFQMTTRPVDTCFFLNDWVSRYRDVTLTRLM